ncbi:MAG: radical SAM protein [Candidatus Kapaibacterium sp.]
MKYILPDHDEPLFRPPSEAASLIFQITRGCSWNRCAFCEMYTTKRFSVRPEEETLEEIRRTAEIAADARKIFLADGDAMAISTRRLINILNEINKYYPKARRISAYASPRNLRDKSVDELIEIRRAGLELIYVGIESGDDEVLRMADKGETYQSTAESMLKAKEADIKISSMIITGLGGRRYSEQHAINSARLVSRIGPEFLSTLVLSFPFGVDHFRGRFDGEFEEMGMMDLLREMRLFIENLELAGSIFRSDHASNYLSLRGILSRDKARLLEKIDYALNNPGSAGLRPEWMRGL